MRNSKNMEKYKNCEEVGKRKNLIFIYYKQYEEARACLDALAPNPDFHAKPARPRETMRTYEPSGARERAKSVVERGQRYSRRNFDFKRNHNTEAGNSPSKGEEIRHVRGRSMSITDISLEKVENLKSTDGIENKEKETLKAEDSKLTVAVKKDFKQKINFCSRSQSVGRLNIEDESKRAELIKKVIKCESAHGGSLDSIFDKDLTKENNDNSQPNPQLQRTKSFGESLDRSQASFHKQRSLWLSAKPTFYKRNGKDL